MAKIKLKFTYNKPVLLGAALCLLLVIVGVSAWMLFNPLEKKGDVGTPVAVEEVRTRATEYAEKGDVDKGLKLYDEEIGSEKDDSKKLKLLTDKTQFATTYKQYDEAITAGEQAAQIDTSLTAALALAKAYEAKGDKEQAIKYYQKLADEAHKDGVATGRDGDRWDRKIAELRSS